MAKQTIVRKMAIELCEFYAYHTRSGIRCCIYECIADLLILNISYMKIIDVAHGHIRRIMYKRLSKLLSSKR